MPEIVAILGIAEREIIRQEDELLNARRCIAALISAAGGRVVIPREVIQKLNLPALVIVASDDPATGGRVFTLKEQPCPPNAT